MTNIELQIPDYFTVDHFQQYQKFTSFDPIDQMVAVVALLTNHTEEEIKDWPVQGVTKSYKAVIDMLSSTQPAFYPVIEWEGVKYGFSPVSKMTMAEYIDLDNLSKNSQENLTDILAILYRPVTENKLGTGKFITKTALKAWSGKVEDPFKYYKIEKYDSETRAINAEKFKNFPVEAALGGLSFFLATALSSLPDSKTSSLNKALDQMKTRKEKRQHRLANITAGFSRSRSWEIPPSFRSLETNQS